jgi:hypothetical protein
VLASVLFLVIAYAGDVRKVGLFLYYALFGFGLFQAAIMPGDISAENLGEERRNGTLGLLFLSGLRSWEIFLGQLAGGLMIALNRLLALLPCLLLPFVMHAIPWSGYVATVQTLLCWAVLCLGVRVFSATIFVDASASELFSQASLVVFGGGAHLLSAFNRLLTGAPLPPGLLHYSPANSIFILCKYFGAATPAQVLLPNSMTLGIAILLFLAAGVILRRSWRDQVYGNSGVGWRAWIAEWRRWHRAKVRALWLEKAPYAWLASRNLSAFKAPALALALILFLWLLGFLAWREYWLIPMNLWLATLLITGVIRWTLHYSLARQIAEDRTGGTFELLLTTPLSPGEIVHSHEQLWKYHVRPLFYIIGVVYLLFFILGAFAKPSGPLALASYTFIWIALFCLGPWSNPHGVWTTFWVSLNLGRPAYALKKYIWQGGGLLSGSIQLVIHADKLKEIPYGTWLEFGLCAAIAAALALASFISKNATDRQGVRKKILSDFREIAAEPLPDKNDSRLKTWNITHRFFKPEPEKIVV